MQLLSQASPLHNCISPQLHLSCSGVGEYNGNAGLLPQAISTVTFVTRNEVRSVPISLCTPAPISLYSGHGGFCDLRWLLLLAVTGRLLHFGRSFWERVLLGGLRLAEEARGGRSSVWPMQNMKAALRTMARRGKVAKPPCRSAQGSERHFKWP